MNNDNNQSTVNNPQPINDSNIVNGQQPNKPLEKKKSIFKIILPIALIGFILLGLFVIFPFIRDNIINNPEHVFKSSIDNVFNTMSSNIKDINYQKGVFEIDASVDTNMEDLKGFSDYTYNMRFGNDSENSLSESKLLITDKNNKKYSISAYLKDSKLYEEFSTFDKLIDLGEYDSSDFAAIFDTLQNYNSDDVKYLMSVMSNTLKESFDKSKFVKGSKKIEVNGKKINVSKNSYKMDSKEIQRLVKCILNGLYKDNKSMDIITKAYNIKKDEVKEIIDEISRTEVNNYSDALDIQNSNDSFLLNIYMNGFDFAGIDIESNNETIVYYYTNNGNFSASYITIFGNLTMDGVKKKGYTDVSIKYAGQEALNLKIKSWNINKMDIDYNIANMINGNVSYNEKKTDNVIDGTYNFTYKQGNDYANIEINTKIDQNGKVADIDEKKAVKLSDEEFEKVTNDFAKSLENTPFADFFYSDSLLSEIPNNI